MIGLTPYPELCHPFGVIKNHSKKKYLKSGCVQALHKCFSIFRNSPFRGHLFINKGHLV